MNRLFSFSFRCWSVVKAPPSNSELLLSSGRSPSQLGPFPGQFTTAGSTLISRHRSLHQDSLWPGVELTPLVADLISSLNFVPRLVPSHVGGQFSSLLSPSYCFVHDYSTTIPPPTSPFFWIAALFQVPRSDLRDGYRLFQI